MSIFNKELERIDWKPKKNQDGFFDNIHNHLKSKKRFLIAKGGMGLGKCMATGVAIKTHFRDFDKFYIATPFAKIKDEWMKDFNKIGLSYGTWIGKKNCILHYHKNIEECNDECLHRSNLEVNGEFTDYCTNKFQEFQQMCPITAAEYYEREGDENCLWSMIKYGIQTEKVVIGDYFPTFSSDILNHTALKGHGKEDSVVIYDEAHRLPDRIKDNFSMNTNFDRLLENVDKEISENKSLLGDNDYAKISTNIIELKELSNRIKSQLTDERDTYQEDFLRDMASEITEILKTYITKIGSLKSEDEDTKPASRKLLELIIFWNNNFNDKNYINYLDKQPYKDKEYLYVKSKVIDISDICDRLFRGWKKVIFISGTMGEDFVTQLGLEPSDVDTPEKLDSFSLEDNILIYNKGDFTSKQRTKSLQELSVEIITIIKKMRGRTIIFIPAISMSQQLQEILEKTNRPIINICQNRKQEIKTRMINKFVETKDGICIYALRQGIEGQNMISEENGYTIENCLVLGYPFMQKGLEYDSSLEYYTSKWKNKIIAKRLFEYYPIGNSLHQALARLKRNDKDEPCCILIGKQFVQGEINKCLPREFKNQISDEFTQVLNFIEVINEKSIG